jgi:hypothetical protein
MDVAKVEDAQGWLRQDHATQEYVMVKAAAALKGVLGLRAIAPGLPIARGEIMLWDNPPDCA